jgi:hypothetical protein
MIAVARMASRSQLGTMGDKAMLMPLIGSAVA